MNLTRLLLRKGYRNRLSSVIHDKIGMDTEMHSSFTES